jgi:hypothetical protein
MPKYHIDLLKGPLVVRSFDYEAVNALGARAGAADWLKKQASTLPEATRARFRKVAI